LLAMLILMGVVMLITAPRLNERVLWFDEVMTRFFSGHSGAQPFGIDGIPTVLRAYSERHTISYYTMSHLWGVLFGTHAFGMRLPHFLFGMLLMAWAYRLGREVTGARLGGWSTAFFLVSSNLFLVYFAEARMYMLTNLCALVSLWAYWRLTHNPAPTRWGWLLLFLGVAVGIITYYPFLFVGVALGIYHLLFGVRGLRGWGVLFVLLGAGVAALFELLWLVFGSNAFNVFLGVTSVIDPEKMFQAVVMEFSNLQPLLLVVVLSYGALHMPNRVRVWLWGVGGAVMLANMWLSTVTEIHHVRNALTMWVFLALGMAWGVVFLARDKRAPLLFVALWGGLAFFSYHTRPPYVYATLGVRTEAVESHRAMLKACLTEGDAVLYAGETSPYMRQMNLYWQEYYNLSPSYSLHERLDATDFSRWWVMRDEFPVLTPGNPLAVHELMTRDNAFVLCPAMRQRDNIIWRIYAQSAEACPTFAPLTSDADDCTRAWYATGESDG
jgi:hypothetical protein